MSDTFKYLFRFCCDPDFNGEAELESLPRFIKEARVDDITVFANVQEINTGHMDKTEQAKYIDLMNKVKSVAAPLGATMSVNHWHTIMHADLGKTLRVNQNFRTMVDKNGLKSTLCVCPLDENWRNYMADIFTEYARLDPYIIWIEDDFRLHNHAPLDWGGCFCDEHMRLYSQKAGKTLSRAEFVKGVLAKGEVHPYRKIWLDVCRDTMVDTARFIGDAIDKVSTKVRVGLMSSLPQVHSAEGRDWKGVLRGLNGDSTGTPPVLRPHLPTYREMAAGEYQMRFNGITMLSRAFCGEETEFYPELENFPYSLYTKSKKFTRFQMLSALPARLDGMAIDLYDLNGNGIVFEEGYQEMLYEVKDFLNTLTGEKVFSGEQVGVAVLASPQSSYYLKTPSGESMEELYPAETVFAALLPAYGIPFYYSEAHNVKGKIVAVSGQYFRKLTEEQIKTMFESNLVIMDGDAAQTLFDLGLGFVAGIESICWKEQDSGAFTYEETVGDTLFVGRKNARASAVLLASDAAFIGYTADKKPLSILCDSFRKERADGLTRCKNAIIFPFGKFNSLLDMPSMFLNNTRRELFAKAIIDDDRFEKPPVILEKAYVFPYCYYINKSLAIYIVNAVADELNGLKIFVGNRKFEKITALKSDKKGKMDIPFTRSGEVVTLDIALGGLETAMLYFE